MYIFKNKHNKNRPFLLDVSSIDLSPITPDTPIVQSFARLPLISRASNKMVVTTIVNNENNNDNNNDNNNNNNNEKIFNVDQDDVELHTGSTLCDQDWKSYSSHNNDNNSLNKQSHHKLSDDTKLDDIENNNDDYNILIAALFNDKGYKLVKKMRNTLQGEMFGATRVKDNLSVAIKRTPKSSHEQRTSQQDGMSIIVEENIILESIILHHLTVANSSISNDYIVKFIDFFETEKDYYLVMEYVNGITLRNYIKKCHQLIQSEKLNLKEYKKICKYMFWQIAANIHWLHHDMSCCHLDLNLDNIMVENGNFIENDDGLVTINPHINCKLVDFGLSEIFKTHPYSNKNNNNNNNNNNNYHNNRDNDENKNDANKENINNNKDNPFLCSKHGMTHNQAHTSPKVFDGEVYDARCADMWSLGIILFTLCVGVEPYKFPNNKLDRGYWALQSTNINDFQSYLQMNDYGKYLNDSLFILITGLLTINDSKRLSIEQVVESQYLQTYYRRYKDRIIEKSQIQKMANYLQRQKMKDFPYYTMNR